MSLERPRVKQLLKGFEFDKLFREELGWDHRAAQHAAVVGGVTYTLHAIAEKRGVQIFVCQPGGDGRVPESLARRQIEKQATELAYEHLIVYIDAAKSVQIWQWVSRQKGQPSLYREHTWHPRAQSGDALLHKLATIAIPLDEEEALDLSGTVSKLRDAFDRDRLTKKFYDRFKAEHAAFLKFIKGITAQGDKEWYASLMLNRLMFVYFIQKKGFLDGDEHYLRHRLAKVQERKGKGKFHTFYQYFLLKLFHEGFGQQKNVRKFDADLRALIGEVPYLNGGLFDVHRLEAENPKIDIPDEAFEKLFAFFDQYDWHLDTRPLRNDSEINPDVLGYIFEKYINQKQMGAYYTKEDITDYISKNTIIPYLFDAAKKKCAVAFQPSSALWRLLSASPDRYLYPAMRHGVIDERGQVIPLPPAVAEGVGDVAKRGGWNKPAAEPFALPTETWREHVARRERCLELRAKLAGGEIQGINDLITYNLDIRQFAEDAIVECEGADFLAAIYQAISSVTVLDPTCGSGAFLFAALSILEPLYEACLERMEGFIEDLERTGEKRTAQKFKHFRETLAEANLRTSRAYFIYKSIIIRNLFGVDIMEEAVEICKLRLFLKLVSQVDSVDQLEPLPDIDFNIRPGNTLVGFATLPEVERTLTKQHTATEKIKRLKGFGDDEVAEIVEEAEVIGRAYERFQEQQTTIGGEITGEHKRELHERLGRLSDKLDRYLAGEYGIDASKPLKFANWQKSHQPFHWFAQFNRIMQNGGFDVVIGNPPYVEVSDTVEQYAIRGFSLLRTGNLFSICVERFVGLMSDQARFGVIVPISAICTPRMFALGELLSKKFSPLHISNFSVRPGKLFVGVDMNLSILVGRRIPGNDASTAYSTTYNRWQGEFREHLFDTISYAMSQLDPARESFPKLGSEIAIRLWSKIERMRTPPELRDLSRGSEEIYYHSGGRYFRKCLKEKLSNEYKELPVAKGWGDILICCLSSSLYYWYWIVASDCYHVTKRDIDEFPIPESLRRDQAVKALADKLLKDLWKNSAARDRLRADGTVTREVNFDVAESKWILDEIDSRIAAHYGLSDEELDFVVSFDGKYRTGDD